MMEKIIIKGGRQLRGKVRISGAKNAVLPVIAASLLAAGPSRIEDVPDLADVDTICQVIQSLGVKVRREGSTLAVDSTGIGSTQAPYPQVRRMRASFLVAGSLLARFGHVRMSMPGGCAIGARPIDLHLKGFASLGASIRLGQGCIEATANHLEGARIYLDFPSVGATENLIMASSLARGTTSIENAAEEPEVVDLANFINAMGGRVSGAGTNIIRVEGVKELRGTDFTVIPDRIEAGTFMVIAAACGGPVTLENVIVDHLKPVLAKLDEMGAEVTQTGDGLQVRGAERLHAADIKTLPYPGFPTDMQAQMTALLAKASGTSVITETVFENRFMHVSELKRMGANIKIEGHSAIVKGVKHLSGAPVRASDLRAGAALVIAGLMARGETEITGLKHLDRGYENLIGKLQGLGAKVDRVSSPAVETVVLNPLPDLF